MCVHTSMAVFAEKLNLAKFSFRSSPLAQNDDSVQYDALGWPGRPAGAYVGFSINRHVGTHHSAIGEPRWGAGLTFGPNQIGATLRQFHSLKF